MEADPKRSDDGCFDGKERPTYSYRYFDGTGDAGVNADTAIETYRYAVG